ncbi:MAG: sigma 54-interacting transcriptional regulator [Bacillota bacterium]
MKTVEKVYEALIKLEKRLKRGVSAYELSDAMKADRANVSRYLNMLYECKRVDKSDERPVLYSSLKAQQPLEEPETEYSFDRIADIQISLQIPIQQAKAAILYPPKGLHTLLLGETGVGKSMFAELMYQFAKESGMVAASAPFIRFNCADYAENPQLLISQIFGVKKGAYTGADKDREGLLRKADGGFLFLDEVHRLSAQGQEMLFTFIDKGIFRPLGETDKIIGADVRIIAATTEEPKSYLLNTFTRRIPMLIELPPLRDRDLTERYYLVEAFIKQESRRIGRSIYANKDSIIAFLLYDCPNNIGQLKSDIQLTCAKAFACFKSQNGEYLVINPVDLPQHVRKGMLKTNDNREKISFLLKNLGDVIRYSYKEDGNNTILEQYDSKDFYDEIEKKLTEYKTSGMKEEEICQIINVDIEKHFRKYIGNLPEKLFNKDLKSSIDEEYIGCAHEILRLAEDKLNKKFDERILLGLALHLQGFIERARKGIKIFHPRLNMIRVDHPAAFMTAMEAAKHIDERFSIHTSLDEIGYIAMFLAAEELELDAGDNDKVGILVVMHGRSTASSMVEVCNALIGIEHAAALDMPLGMTPDSMYERVRERVIELDKGRGVILMVDMGSLVSFADMICQDTGILVKCMDMVSTPLLIDTCRKAVMGRDIYYIIESSKDANVQANANITANERLHRNIIITACFTGEGASERLKSIIEGQLPDSMEVDIIPMNILNRKDFLSRIGHYKERNRVLAIVGTVNMHVEGVPFISAADIFSGSGLDAIDNLIQEEDSYIKIGKSLKSHMKSVDSMKLVNELRQLIVKLEKELKVYIKSEVKTGILLHMCFLVDKLKAGEKEALFHELEEFEMQFSRELGIVKHSLNSLEASYGIAIGKNEAAFICKMFISNNEGVQA